MSSVAVSTRSESTQRGSARRPCAGTGCWVKRRQRGNGALCGPLRAHRKAPLCRLTLARIDAPVRRSRVLQPGGFRPVLNEPKLPPRKSGVTRTSACKHDRRARSEKPWRIHCRSQRFRHSMRYFVSITVALWPSQRSANACCSIPGLRAEQQPYADVFAAPSHTALHPQVH